MFNKEIYERLESELANRFRIEEFRSGGHTIRDQRGWRENEIQINYIWLITFDRAFFGKGGILGIKYEASQFREIKNIEKLVKTIFSIDEKGEIESIYEEEEQTNFSQIAQKLNQVDLLEANKGITSDGIIYRIKFVSMNIKTTIEVNNPNHESWRNLEGECRRIWKEMSENSGDEKLKKIFE